MTRNTKKETNSQLAVLADLNAPNATIDFPVLKPESATMSQSKKYWKGLEELQETPEFIKNKHNEFPEELPVDALTG
ncbi:MAG: TAT-variant-translocated molybdopterin oxidoreductase, partial [Bacteroidia bacterium]|nr:TAT-variant-translocated molybdopterin oxidoreductase [Bacteroidia bacterium]